MTVNINSISVPDDGIPIGVLRVGELFIPKDDQSRLFIVLTCRQTSSDNLVIAIEISNTQERVFDPHQMVYPVSAFILAKAHKSINEANTESPLRTAHAVTGRQFNMEIAGEIVDNVGSEMFDMIYEAACREVRRLLTVSYGR